MRAGGIQGAHLIAGLDEEDDLAVDGFGRAVLAGDPKGHGARLAFAEAGDIHGTQPCRLALREAGREHGPAQYEGERTADNRVDSLNDANEKCAPVATARRRLGHLVVHASPADSGAKPPAPTGNALST